MRIQCRHHVTERFVFGVSSAESLNPQQYDGVELWGYAEKMASMTDTFIDSAMSQLNFSASKLSSKMDNTQVLDSEVDRLRLQTNSFNSVVIVDAEGTIIAISPETLAMKCVVLMQEKLANR
ncbi:hypothetical protein VV208B2_46730 (plasmid) [Vibrio vulnificus]|nr:hypothetical protein VV208B2_46730 [Vibrio vulnificus]BDP38510.1 hypothetical protein VA208B3_48810 [Vibrio alginolyticus]